MAESKDRFIEAMRQIEAKSLDMVGLISVADALTAAGDWELASGLYRYWLAVNPDSPLRYAAAFNCGSMLYGRGDLAGAQTYLQQAIDSNPDFHPARLNLAGVLERRGDAAAASAALRDMLKALSPVNPANMQHKVTALKHVATQQRATAAAEAALLEAFEIAPTQPELMTHWIANRQSRCIWPLFKPAGRMEVDEIKRYLAPLSASMYVDDPLLHLAVAREYVSQLLRGSKRETVGPWPAPANPKREKLRIGYLSSDLCNHAIGYLMTDLFAQHDRTRYEIVAYNIGERNDDGLQKKIMADVDRWVDIKHLSDEAASALIIKDEVDILLDINGHTNYQRTRLLSMRPAPIIANWLGYPGTTGSDVHDYIIADDFIIPETHEAFYSEKVLRLPCYQPNGKLIPIPMPAKSRTELGLPEQGVVYCCFNGAVKITEPVFSRWMTILRAVNGSVLWLRGSAGDTDERLRAEAAKRGVAPERLVFLPFTSNTEYLACHRYADVFLDTFPYGAHTTASDALRMGVPIVTLAGIGFASRVCGSLSRAAGVPEMICDDPDKYVALATELGNDPAKLGAIKQRLAGGLPESILFDSAALVRRLEELLERMWTDYCAGVSHRPDLDGLDLRQVVAAGAGRDERDYMPFETYRSKSRVILDSMARD